MNKQVNGLTPDQKRNLIKNTVFTIGDSPNAIGFETLLDTILCEPAFIFNIVNNGLNVVCPLGFVTIASDGQRAVEYYIATATEGKHEDEVSYVGMSSESLLTFQQCAALDNTTPVFDPLHHTYLVQYFQSPASEPVKKEQIAPYTLDESSITFNITTYLFDKVSKQKGLVTPGTALPIELLEESELFDTEVERDAAYNIYMKQFTPKKVNIFDAIRMANSKGQFGNGHIG